MNRRWFRFAALVWLFILIPILAQVWWHPQYGAPWAGLHVLILVQCLRHLRLWGCRGRQIGRHIAQALVVSFVLMAFCSPFWPGQFQHNLGRERQRVQDKYDELAKTEGVPVFILIRGDPGRTFNDDTVYNEPDVENAQVIWARVLKDEDKNQKLRQYFKSRILVEMDFRIDFVDNHRVFRWLQTSIQRPLR